MKSYILNGLNLLLAIFGILIIVSIILEYGFYLEKNLVNYLHILDLIILWYFLIQFIAKLIILDTRVQYLKKHWFETLIVILVFLEFFVFIEFFGFQEFENTFFSGKIYTLSKIWIVTAEILIIMAYVSKSSRLNRWVAALDFHPSQILMLSFLIIIMLGTFLLMAPRATVSGSGLSFIDALFTATSATCVTGLVVVDTGSYFSPFGQLVILILIQIGGLGLMTFSSFFVLLFRRHISIREKTMVKELMNYQMVGTVVQVLKYSVIITFALETLGAIILYVSWYDSFNSQAMAIYSSIFHSISAFCNAGFSLNATSLENYVAHVGVIVTISSLIIMGGLGFPVLIYILNLPMFHRVKSKVSIKVYQLHTKLTLIVTGILLLVGFVFFLVVEWNHAFKELPIAVKVLNAFFQSVTTRTAGFNTIPMTHFIPASLMLMIAFMYMGASPGSTGGGIKTTTVGLLFASAFSVLRGRNSIDLFKREIPAHVFNRTLVVITISSLFILILFTAMLLTNTFEFKDLLFEIFSAFGTVGLSTGITDQLNGAGKIILIICMYFGRIGVLTLTLAVIKPREKQNYQYPPANVMIG